MSKRQEHVFQFQAGQIAAAARGEADYHEERTRYWQGEMDGAYDRVRQTMGVRIERQPITGGWRPSIAVDHGDGVAFSRMQEAAGKVQEHQRSAERYRVDERLYATQGERTYELSSEDVAYFRLGGEPRPE